MVPAPEDEPLTPCPHCRGLTASAPHPELRWVCGACGGPRVPSALGAGAAAPLLVEVKRERFASVALRVAAAFVGTAALFSLGLGALLFAYAHFAAAVLGVSGVGFAALAAGLLRRARKSKGRANEALDEAWVAAASAVVRARAGTTAPELARALHTEVEGAEQLLARVSAYDDVHVRVAGGEGAELVYEASAETERTDDPAASRREGA